MKPNNFRAYFRAIPQDDLVALLAAIRTPAASNGNGAGRQSQACRGGTHRECVWTWYECPHHRSGAA